MTVWKSYVSSKFDAFKIDPRFSYVAHNKGRNAIIANLKTDLLVGNT